MTKAKETTIKPAKPPLKRKNAPGQGRKPTGDANMTLRHPDIDDDRYKLAFLSIKNIAKKETKRKNAPGQGRKPIGEKNMTLRRLYIDDERYQVALEAGDGEFSKGVRLLIDKAKKSV